MGKSKTVLLTWPCTDEDTGRSLHCYGMQFPPGCNAKNTGLDCTGDSMR